MPSHWKCQYYNHNNQHHFKYIIDPITENELVKCLELLPNNKSLGPSRIPNEFWKKELKSLKEVLLVILNQCINESNIPSKWKKASIVLILKKEEWANNFQNTRPIILLET